MEAADDRSTGIMGIDVERTVVNVDRHRILASGGWGGSEAETVEGFDHFPHRLLRGRVPEGGCQLPAPPHPLLCRLRHRSFPVGVAEERHDAPDEEADFGVAGEERLPEPVSLGRPTPPARSAGLLLEDPCLEEPFQVGPHRRRVDPQEAGEFGNLARSFLERLHDGQATDISQQAVAFGSGSLGKRPVHHDHRTRTSRGAAMKTAAM
ncbi:MAG TPA: hypothetical protein VJ456_00330 [Acidimicrobiia bacterium]|nr:hypothetical protein [Acidimicrobiia bacterium]